MGPAGGAKVTIDAVRVYAGSVEGTLLEDSANADATNDIVITITNGVASISGLDKQLTGLTRFALRSRSSRTAAMMIRSTVSPNI